MKGGMQVGVWQESSPGCWVVGRGLDLGVGDTTYQGRGGPHPESGTPSGKCSGSYLWCFRRSDYTCTDVCHHGTHQYLQAE